ncbi:hypothetical protein BaRGS_00005252, partial [Batillaria attramentaria]
MVVRSREDMVTFAANQDQAQALSAINEGAEDRTSVSPLDSISVSKQTDLLSDSKTTVTTCIRPRRKKFVDKSHLHRTAMGDYVVPEGGKPLTSLAAELPSPTTYSPSANPVQHTYPQWSIYSRTIYEPKAAKKPAPNRYMMPEVLNWKRKKVPLSAKIKVNRKLIAGPCKAGPAGYMVDNFNCGKLGLKHSMTKGRRGPVMPGPPNSLVEPCETPGFKTPGPQYDIQGFDDYRPHAFHATFTSVPKQRIKEPWPAPVDYWPDVPGAAKPPRWSMGLALRKKKKAEGPGPNAYTIQSTIGDGPAYSITMPRPNNPPRRAPSPTAYMREREYFHKEKIQFHMRPPEMKRDTKPGPDKYYTRKEPDPHDGYSLKAWVKPSIPDINHSAFAE